MGYIVIIIGLLLPAPNLYAQSDKKSFSCLNFIRKIFREIRYFRFEWDDPLNKDPYGGWPAAEKMLPSAKDLNTPELAPIVRRFDFWKRWERKLFHLGLTGPKKRTMESLEVTTRHCQIRLNLTFGELEISDANGNYDERLESIAYLLVASNYNDLEFIKNEIDGRELPSTIAGPVSELLFLANQVLDRQRVENPYPEY